VADYYSTKAQCPFWVKGSVRENKIFCEGPCEEARLQLWFRGNEKARRVFMSKYCCMRYATCPFYKITEGKY
jgi:hypothetical protein